MENHHFQWVNPLFRLGHFQKLCWVEKKKNSWLFCCEFQSDPGPFFLPCRKGHLCKIQEHTCFPVRCNFEFWFWQPPHCVKKYGKISYLHIFTISYPIPIQPLFNLLWKVLFCTVTMRWSWIVPRPGESRSTVVALQALIGCLIWM